MVMSLSSGVRRGGIWFLGISGYLVISPMKEDHQHSPESLTGFSDILSFSMPYAMNT